MFRPYRSCAAMLLVGLAFQGCREPLWMAKARTGVQRLGDAPLRRGAYTGLDVRFPEGVEDREALARHLADTLSNALTIRPPAQGEEGGRVVLVDVRRFEPDAPPKSRLRRVGEGSVGGTLTGALAGLEVGGPFVPFTVPLGAGVGLLTGVVDGLIPGPKTQMLKRLGYLPYRVEVVVRVPPLPGTSRWARGRDLTLVHPGIEGPFMTNRSRSFLEPGLKPLGPSEVQEPGRVARMTLDALAQALVVRLRQTPEEAGAAPPPVQEHPVPPEEVAGPLP